MPRRASSRLRAGAGSSTTGVSDGESSVGCGGGGGGFLPFPPSPGKRKTRSPVDEEGMAGLANPVRCMAFQSPKKKALGVGGGIGDSRSNGTFDKENDLLLITAGTAGRNGKGGVVPALQFGDVGVVGGSSFRLSASSAFSHHTSKGGATGSTAHRTGGRRRGREEIAIRRPPAPAPSTPRLPTGLTKIPGPPSIFAPPASVARSPDLRRRRSSSRRLSRNNGLGRSLDSNSSSGSNGRSPSPAKTPGAIVSHDTRKKNTGTPAASGEVLALTRPRLRSSRAGPGCAAGGRRASMTTTTTLAESAASPTPEKNSGGGSPAGPCRRVVGGGRLGIGSGGGGDTMSEPDCSPHRSPVHRLTQSLQKWDPGSRYINPEQAIGKDSSISKGANGDGDVDSSAVEEGVATGGTGREVVGASWNGQELRRTLEKERMGQGRRRRHSVASADDIYPQGRFGGYSPISPASSAASITLGEFDTGTPASARRSWRSSPSTRGGKVEAGGEDSSNKGQGGSAGVGSEEHFGIVRMEGSWSDDETRPSRAAMRLAFSSPADIPGTQTPTGIPPASTVTAVASTTSSAHADTATPSTARWQHPFSPVKPQRSKSSADASEDLALSSPNPSSFSRSAGSAVLAVRRDFAASPEQNSGHSVRDLMNQCTDDEEDDGPGGGGGALVRRRRRRPRPELALRTLEMPDATDMTVDDGRSVVTESASAGAGTVSKKAIAGAKSAVTSKFESFPNPLVSPAFSRRGLSGDSSGFGSARTTAGPRWEYLHNTPATATTSTENSWIGGYSSKGKGRDWAQSASGFKIGAVDDTQDVTGGMSRENNGATLSGLSGADTSGASDTSSSLFIKSRPIPDQSAFSSTRLSKTTTSGALYSPLGSGGGGPATGPVVGPLCLTPRKSTLRCPPTPQRTPTWDGLEDSLLLEGAGSCSGDLKNGESLRGGSKFWASGPHSPPSFGGLGGEGFTRGSDMAVEVALDLENTSGGGDGGSCGARTASILEMAATEGGVVESSGSDGGGRSSVASERKRRGHRGKGGRFSVGSGNARSGSGRVNAAEGAAKAGGGAAGSGGTGASASAGDGPLDFKKDFEQMGPVGEGGFSIVWKVRAIRTGRLYAIKRSKREFRGRRDRDRCLLEARALQRLLEHPGVLRFERAWQEKGHFCLQTELCELGTLKDFLERLPSRREVPEAAVWQVLHDVGQALRHVHAMGLVHLDVKPANLLIGDEGGVLKIGDFGMATAYGEGVESVGDGQEGDTLYMAKELLSSVKRLPSADMFSLGLTVYEVATRIELPGDGEDWHALRDGRALSIGLTPSRSPELTAVLRQLMHPDPSKRPTADELCKHPRVSSRVSLLSGKNSIATAIATATATATPSSAGARSGVATSVVTAAAVTTTAAAAAGHERDDFVFSQARAWRAAEEAAMDHPTSGLRTPTGDMSARYIFQQNG